MHCVPAAEVSNMTNNKALFESLHLQYHPMVLQMCLGYVKGDVPLAHDLAQEVFVNVWNALGKFRNQSSHKTWIYRITVNTCLQHLRKEKNRQTVAVSSVANLPHIEPATDTAHQSLYHAIGQLNEVDRIVIMMVLDELDYAEIAEVTGISPLNLRVRIHRIKQKLKKLLEHEQRP